MIGAGELRADLAQCTGTEQYWKNESMPGLNYTDGIKRLAQLAECYWLITLVYSWQKELEGYDFQIWTLEIREDRSAVITAREDTNLPAIAEQEIPYTDFPLPDFSFYFIDGVMLLKSEY